MTGYGETVTPKENLFDLYLVAPDSASGNWVNGSGKDGSKLTDWKTVGPDNHVLQFNNFHFAYYNIDKPFYIGSRLRASGDLVFMQFCLEGYCFYTSEQNKKEIIFRSSEHNIICIPKDQGLTFAYESNELKVVNIYFERNFILKYIPEDHLLANRISRKFLGSVIGNNLSITAKMQTVLMDIINSEFEGHLRKLYTQAKIIELLTLQLAQFEEAPAAGAALKQADADKMVRVKELIESQIEQSISLPYLARAVGTNEQYLKKHFKIMFGSTVFNYILSLKMEKARQLLLEGNHKIADVARTAGYKHATHFSSAFKKYFGYLPNKLKLTCLVLGPEYLTLLVKDLPY